MNKHPVLSVQDLSIAFKTNTKYKTVVKSVSFDLLPKEILGVVGESGSGKSVTSLALMGLLPKSISQIKSGTIHLDGENITNYSAKDLQEIRGEKIAMIFQEPMSALNPSMTCGSQILECLRQHTALSVDEAQKEVMDLLKKVKIPNPKLTYRKYPHEISGGQQQRIVIAMAIACKPKVLIADEPTTALDVTVQKEIIILLKSIQEEYQISVIFISHDLALIAEIADRILVMYKGKLVETGNTKTIFKSPQNNYTKALIGSRPSLNVRLEQLPTVQDVMSNSEPARKISKRTRDKRHSILYSKPPILEVQNLEKTYYSKSYVFKPQSEFKAVDNVSFKLFEGETLGLVGESGCGKSTLGKAILQLDKATAGRIIYKGKDITNLSNKELRLLRKEIQIIFQDPYASLNPRLTVGNAIIEPMKVHKLYPNEADCRLKAFEILEQVGLEAGCFDYYPHEFSGGQRQRIGIARTIAVNPKVIICDESVSALDISVQAQVLNLLNSLKKHYGFSYIFISHDLAVVKYMADHLLVMNQGKIEEFGEADAIYKAPQNAYTKALIEAIPKGL